MSVVRFSYIRKVWIEITKMPEHHHCFNRVKYPVATFGKLCAINREKAEYELSSYDALIDYNDMAHIPHVLKYYFDDLYRTDVRIKVVHTWILIAFMNGGWTILIGRSWRCSSRLKNAERCIRGRRVIASLMISVALDVDFKIFVRSTECPSLYFIFN